MRWKSYLLPASDDAANKHVLRSLSVGAHSHTLTKKLLRRFSSARGSMIAFAWEDLDVDEIEDYDPSPTYRGGLDIHQVWNGDPIPIGDRSIDGLIAWLFDFLGTSEDRLIVVEDWLSKRTNPWLTSPERSKYFQTRLAFHNDEVFHVLASGDADRDMAEDTIRSGWHYWLNAICVAGVALPAVTQWSDEFLDVLVANTCHIFVSAFDEEGFLLWSPTGSTAA
jgi:hypothetical protein